MSRYELDRNLNFPANLLILNLAWCQVSNVGSEEFRQFVPRYRLAGRGGDWTPTGTCVLTRCRHRSLCYPSPRIY